MRKLIQLFLLLLPIYCNAQQNSIVVENFLSQYCVGSTVALKLKTTGNFNVNNTFVIEISDAFGKNFKEIKRSTSNITEFIVPEELIASENYLLRVNGTSPAVSGISSNRFKILTKPKATINYIGSSQINPYKILNLKIKITGGEPYNLALNDSTKINNFSVTNYDSTTTISKIIDRSFIYKISKIENACGLGTATGEANIKTNPFGLLLTGLSDIEYSCPGKKITYSYSANGTLEANNSFKIRIKSTDDKLIADLDSKNNGKGFLESTLPTNLEHGKSYSLQLISSNPEIYSDTRSISIPQKAVIGSVVNGISQYGVVPSLLVRIYQGLPPYSVILSNGQTHHLTTNINEIPLSDFNAKTSFVTLKDQCNTIKSSVDSINVSLPNFITIDSIPSKSYCVGETLEVPITTNMVFESKSKIYFFLWEENYVVRPKFEAKIIGNKLVAKIPPMQGGYYSLMITTENPYSEHIAFNRRVKINQPSTSSLSIRSNALGSWLVLNPGSGSEPTSVKLKIDEKEHLLDFRHFSQNQRTYEMKINTQRNQVFSLLEVKNECGLSQINQSAKTISSTIKTPQNRHIIIGQLEKSKYCVGETLKVPFTVEGGLGENEIIELYKAGDNGYATVKLAESKTSPVVLVINSNTFSYSRQLFLRIKNSDIISDERSVSVVTKPSIGSTTKFKQIIKNQPLGLDITCRGDFPIYYKLNGTARIIPNGSFGNLNDYETFNLYPKENMNFKFESVYNSCGYMDQTIPNEIKIEAYTSKIFFDEFSTSFSSGVCSGQLLKIPFKAIYIRNNTKVFAELTDLNGLNFKEILTYQEGNELIVQIPKDIKYSNKYKIRLVAKNLEDTFYSEERTFTVYEPATGKISTKEGKDIIEKSRFNEIYLKLDFTGSPAFQTVISNFYNSSAYLYPAFRYFDYTTNVYVNPTKKTTYTIAQLVNECGYGKVSGNITVKVNPFVSSLTLNKNKICQNEKAIVNLTLNGDFADEDLVSIKLKKYINTSYVTIKELTKIKAKDNKALEITLSEDLETGMYVITAEFENFPVESQFPAAGFTLLSPAKINIGGTAIANSGNSVFINATLIGSAPVSYELNDGTKGTLNFTGVNLIKIKPNATFEYNFKSASNECGIAISTGSSRITVNEPSNKTIDIPEMPIYGFCQGTSINLPFKATGNFSPLNNFVVQISDKDGNNYKDIPGAVSTQSPIKFNIPLNIPIGENYRLKVISTEAGVQSNSSPNFIRIFEKIKIKVTGPKYLESSKTVKLKIETLSQTGYSFYVIDSLSKRSISNSIINTNPYELIFNLPSPTILKFVAVNSCGAASFDGPNFLNLDLLMANENEPSNSLMVFPNPTSGYIKVKKNQKFTSDQIQFYNSLGQSIILNQLAENNEEISFDVSPLQNGNYFIIFQDINTRLVRRFSVNN